MNDVVDDNIKLIRSVHERLQAAADGVRELYELVVQEPRTDNVGDWLDANIIIQPELVPSFLAALESGTPFCHWFLSWAGLYTRHLDDAQLALWSLFHTLMCHFATTPTLEKLFGSLDADLSDVTFAAIFAELSRDAFIEANPF